MLGCFVFASTLCINLKVAWAARKGSLLPYYATSRCLEAMHACIQNIEQLPGHAGAQLASRPLDVVLWTS
jgi:hypothetical protein